ncbi:MAG: hypothetical protein R6X02_05165 [Enhygromyxa sp.]
MQGPNQLGLDRGEPAAVGLGEGGLADQLASLGLELGVVQLEGCVGFGLGPG